MFDFVDVTLMFHPTIDALRSINHNVVVFVVCVGDRFLLAAIFHALDDLVIGTLHDDAVVTCLHLLGRLCDCEEWLFARS